MTYTLPRHLNGATPSVLVHNTAAAELDALAWSITVRRTRRWFLVEGGGTQSPYNNIDYVIPWETVSGGSNRGNWSPGLAPAVKITQSGMYLMLLQVRFAYPYTGNTTGRRWARIMLNGTSPNSDTIGVNAEADFSYPNTGLTVQAVSVRPLQAGDTLWCGFRGAAYINDPGTQATSMSDALLPDLGGTYFTVVRIGPGAGALTADLGTGGTGGVPRLESGSLPPSDPLNFFAQAIDNLGVCARPRRTTSFTVPFGVAQLISWQQDGVDTRGDMWDPAEPTKTTIRVSGTYYLELRIRWPVEGGYPAGGHAAYLYKNVNTTEGVLGSIIKPPPTIWEGTFCVVRAIARLAVGDVIYAAAVSGDGTSTVGAEFFGGTSLFVARVGRSGDGGSVIEGQEFDTGPVPEEVRQQAIDGVRDGPMGGPVRDGGITA